MMRRMFVAATVFGLLALAAPDLQAQGLVLGAKGGVNIANVDEDVPDADPDSRTGVIAGAFLGIEIGDFLVLQPEAFYSQKGFEEEDLFDDVAVQAKLKLDYIEIPLLLKGVFTPAGSVVRPAAYVGGSLSFEASCEVEGEGDGVTASVDCDDPDIEFERKKTDFGLVFGGELQYWIGEIVLLVDGRYNLGLADVSDEDPDTVDLKNRAWSIMAGIGVRLN